MKKEHRTLNRLLRRLDIPAESLTRAPRITMSGGGRVLIEGHRGLLEYEAECVAASVAGGVVRVKGEDLMLETMNGRELLLSGRIWAVEME